MSGVRQASKGALRPSCETENGWCPRLHKMHSSFKEGSDGWVLLSLSEIGFHCGALAVPEFTRARLPLPPETKGVRHNAGSLLFPGWDSPGTVQLTAHC